MKVVNITHSDVDGATCAILIKEFCRQKGFECEVHKATVNNIDSIFKDVYNESHDQLTIITDVSFKNEPSLVETATNIVLIDHHGTANKSKVKKKLVKTDEGESATRLVYNYLTRLGTNFDEKFKKLADIAHDYDTYALTMATSRAVNYLYYFYYFERFVSRFKNGFDKLTEDELLFLKCKRDQIKKALTNLKVTDIMENEVAFIIEEDNINELAEHLYKEQNYKYVFIYSPKRSTLGMRSCPDAPIHCGEFLELFGGGGHLHSGGVQVKTMADIDKILDGFETVWYEFHPPF